MKDAAQRERALDVTRSFIVQAPAGSGKTDLLVRRFLKLLTTVKKPEEILAITFTKKAAAEMRKRVLKELPNAAEIAHRLRIQTIDAFCAALTRQVPVLARFGAQPEIIEDARPLYKEAAARVFEDLNKSPPSSSPRCSRAATAGCARPAPCRRAQNSRRLSFPNERVS